MKTPFAARLLALALCSTGLAAAPNERPQDRWNLADLYPNVAAWNEDLARVEAQLPQVAACKGHLGDSAKRLKECLDLQYDVAKRFSRLSVYAGELSAEDTGNAESLALQQRSRVVGAKFGEATSYVNPELLAVGAPRIEAFQREEPGLGIYRIEIGRAHV